MTPENFTYWLQGFVELNQAVPTEAQWRSIKEHLSLASKLSQTSVSKETVVSPAGPVKKRSNGRLCKTNA